MNNIIYLVKNVRPAVLCTYCYYNDVNLLGKYVEVRFWMLWLSFNAYFLFIDKSFE